METSVGSVERAIHEVHRRHLPSMAPRLAQAVLVTVLSGFFLIAFINIIRRTSSLGSAVSLIVYMAAIFLLQVGYFGRPRKPPRPPLSYVALLAMAGLAYLPFLQFGSQWSGFPGYLAGSLLLALPAAAGAPLFGLVVVSMAGVEASFDSSLNMIVYTTVATAITGLVVYGLSRLAGMVFELHAARDELAQMAVARERLRFARDLHDLLGLSLSAITLKSELTSRLMSDQPTRAREELTGILAISRQALSDVRSVASGYRELSLDDECESAQAVLTAAEVGVTMRREYGELPAYVGTVLATVLREGVTNVLRHSKAERCDIALREAGGEAVIDIVNDGVSDEITEESVSAHGSGIRNLSERIAAVGGRLTTELTDEREFRLHAVVPLPSTEDSSPKPGRPWWRRQHVL